VDARQQLPKRNKMVKTPKGVGKVVDVLPLQAKIVVEIPEIGYLQFSKDEIEDAEEPGKDRDEVEKGKANG
jgi:hypothetical protein